MSSYAFTAALGLLLIASHAPCGAQGFTLIENCPIDLKPVATREANLPLTGRYDYHVVARFAIDVDGSVVAPRVKESRLVLGSDAITLHASVDAAFLAALREWKYARRPKPCAATLELTLRSRG